MFTSSIKFPSDVLYISEQPIDSVKINEILSLNKQNHNLNFVNCNKIYPELVPLDLIYQEILQNPINDLFYKKNSCIFFFGPTSGGKSYLLRGSPYKDENESGLLTRAINEIFQRLQFNSSFVLKISVYQIFLDKIYDLLSNDDNMELNIEVNYSEINSNCNINILGLNKKEIKNSEDYDLTLREAIYNRRKLSQALGISNIKKKSHFIISLFLENIIDNNNNVGCEPFSQFDFVELISSNYGLLNENEENLDIDKTIFGNSKEVFNSVAENIICLSHNSYCDNDSLLTLALKNTLKPSSNIIFANCVIPWEFPLKDSYSALIFTNMLFNQIYKSENNSNINLLNNINSLNSNSGNSLTYMLDNSENNTNVNKNNIFNNINNSDNKENLNQYLKSLSIDKMDYLFPEKDYSKKNINQELDYKNEINNGNKLFTKYNNNTSNNNKKASKKKINYKKSKNDAINKSYDIDNKKSKKKIINNNNYESFMPRKRPNNISNDKRKIISSKEKKLQKLNEDLKELEAKSKKLNQNSIDSEYIYSNNNIENDINTNNYTNTIYIDDNIKTIQGINQNPNSNTSIQYGKIKEEYGDLKSNNIILKEDINRLEQTNKNLESSLNEQRNRNLEILNQNEELSNRILKLEELLDEANLRDEKYKINEINIEKLLNEKLFLNAKINEDEKNYKIMKEDKVKYEI